MRNTQINTDDCSTTLTTSATAEWAPDSENTPLYAVVSAVAEAEEVDPVDLPPLYNAIDLEALNTLFTSESGTVSRVEFEYAGYSVVVRGEGSVEVCSANV
ncbi:HalOD1 output domain-containing protein [Natrialbaceae archaeon GCM10025810]|uniref:HalOD1 output domain-containing protein n=1 Tax=Halovalidus salilacus TaxID=3075124 RepID=UPI0036097DB2